MLAASVMIVYNVGTLGVCCLLQEMHNGFHKSGSWPGCRKVLEAKRDFACALPTVSGPSHI